MKLNTGDILLFDERPNMCCMAGLDTLIKCCTRSKYSHCALVVVDPPFAPQCKGTFVWESSWHGTADPQDNTVKFGVQLTPVAFYTDNYPGIVTIYRRRPILEKTRRLFSDEALTAIHKKVYLHGYDTRVKDWCSALFKKRIQRQTDVFTCSAFVSFVLTELEILEAETPWTIVSAADLSSRASSLVEWRFWYDRDTRVERNPLCESLIANDVAIDM